MTASFDIRSRFRAALYTAAALKIVALLVLVGGIVGAIGAADKVDQDVRLVYITAEVLATVFAASLVAAAAYGLEVLVEIHAEVWQANNLEVEPSR